MSRDIEYYTERRAELDLVLSDPTLPIISRDRLEKARTFCTKRIDQLKREEAARAVILQN